MGALGNTGIGIVGLSSTIDMLEDAKPETASYRVSAETDYAVYVELGTKNMKAQPYVRPAVRQVMRNAGVYADEADDTDEFVELLAEAIAEKARSNAPVDTGELSDSITVEEL